MLKFSVKRKSLLYYHKKITQMLKSEMKNIVHVSPLAKLILKIPFFKEHCYYGCGDIKNLAMVFLGSVDNPRLLRFCCEELHDIPVLPLSGTVSDIENFISLQKNAISEGTRSNTERTLYKDCLKCSRYGLVWGAKKFISSINLSMYPAPCQSKCIYCSFLDRKIVDASAREGYERLFSLLDDIKKQGLVSSNTTYQVASGEITIHPYKDRIFDIVKDHAAHFLTNCFIYDEKIGENLMTNPRSNVNLSIDSGTPETWYKIKGFDNFNECISNLSRYYNKSSGNGQIILKYIILPGINDSTEDYLSVIEIMKKFSVNNLKLSRDVRSMYKISDIEREKLINSTTRLAALLHKNMLTYTYHFFTPTERSKIESMLKKQAGVPGTKFS